MNKGDFEKNYSCNDCQRQALAHLPCEQMCSRERVDAHRADMARRAAAWEEEKARRKAAQQGSPP
jgi:hypothetical protein